MLNEKDLVEQLLSNQERAIARQVQRVSKLTDTLVALDKSLSTMSQLPSSSFNDESKKSAIERSEQIKAYLAESFTKILLSTKIPGTEQSPSK